MTRHDPLLGGVVANRFRIQEKIAAGGFGAIYRAAHIASGHEVAIKVLHPQLAADPNVIARFRREGTTLSKLRAPHTVTTYEFGETADGMLYIVMELLKGVSLHERLRERVMLPWREALQIARAICISLAEAHALGIVHRDLKPANIHLESRGDADYVKVLDFGIAKIKRGSTTDEQPELTNAGQMIGTIDYMSPEQILGGQPDGRSDIFTLGILLFEMCAGRRPFAESATPTSMLAALLTQTPPRLSTFVPVPHSLDKIVAKCLMREAAERFTDVGVLSDEIDRVLLSSSDDGATRTIAIGLHMQKWEDEEATVMADAEYPSVERSSSRRLNTLESSIPPAPRPSKTPQPVIVTPPPRARPPTPAPPQRTPGPQRMHPPTSPPQRTPGPQRAHPPTPSPPQRTPGPQRMHPPTPSPPQHTPGPQRMHPPTPFPPYPYPPVQPDAQAHVPRPFPPPPSQQHIPYPQWQAQQQPQPRQSTPAVPQPVINPSAQQIPVDNSGWQVPKAGRASQPMDPSAWQSYAGNATYMPPGGDPGRPSQPFIPPGSPNFIPADRDRGSGPITPGPGAIKTYDPNRDATVGRIIWIVALLIVAGLGIAIYQVLS
ncbi:MAG: protein kinase [Myxococcota bacterium]|nr:protein kinase [Myxococcota bacterium]